MKKYFYIYLYDKNGESLGTIGTPDPNDIYKQIGEFLGKNAAIMGKITIEYKK